MIIEQEIIIRLTSDKEEAGRQLFEEDNTFTPVYSSQ